MTTEVAPEVTTDAAIEKARQALKDALGAYGEASYAHEVWGGRRDEARKALESAQAALQSLASQGK